MKKLTFLFVLLFSLGSMSTFAQNLRDVLKEIDEIGFQMNPMPPELEGSPYLNDEWQISTIETTDKEEVRVMARYRYYDGIVEIKKNNDEKIYTLGKKHTNSITIGKEKFIPLTYTNEKGITKADFFRILADGQLRFIIFFDKVITLPSSNGYVDNPSEVKAKRKYYVYKQDTEEMVAIKKLSKKSILPLFGKHAKQIESYAKKEKLSFKNPDKLAEIISYYNTNLYKSSKENK